MKCESCSARNDQEDEVVLCDDCYNELYESRKRYKEALEEIKKGNESKETSLGLPYHTMSHEQTYEISAQALQPAKEEGSVQEQREFDKKIEADPNYNLEEVCNGKFTSTPKYSGDNVTITPPLTNKGEDIIDHVIKNTAFRNKPTPPIEDKPESCFECIHESINPKCHLLKIISKEQAAYDFENRRDGCPLDVCQKCNGEKLVWVRERKEKGMLDYQIPCKCQPEREEEKCPKCDGTGEREATEAERQEYQGRRHVVTCECRKK